MVAHPIIVSQASSRASFDRHPRVVVASVLLVNAHTWGLNSVRFSLEHLRSVRDSDSTSSPMPSSSPIIFEREYHLGHPRDMSKTLV